MNVTWETIKEEVGVSKHLIYRCIQRNMIPRDIYDAYRYGKKIYYIENEELVTKYMYMGIAIVQRNNILITAMYMHKDKVKQKAFMSNNKTFVFSEK